MLPTPNEDARAILELAELEARKMGHSYLGAEHLLLALTATPFGSLFYDYKIDEPIVRSLVSKINGPRLHNLEETKIASSYKIIVQRAAHEAQTSKCNLITPAHLIIALLRMPETSELLGSLGVDTNDLLSKALGIAPVLSFNNKDDLGKVIEIGYSIANDLALRSGGIIGKTRCELSKLLGLPDKESTSELVYDVSYLSQNKGASGAQLLVKFVDDIAIAYTLTRWS